MTLSSVFSIIPLYAAVLGLLFVVFTLRVGAYRFKHRVSLGDGGDEQLLKRVRGQGNFTETVPIALILLLLVEASGASAVWLHSLGLALVLGRVAHYLQLTGLLQPLLLRMLGMIATLLVILTASGYLLVNGLL